MTQSPVLPPEEVAPRVAGVKSAKPRRLAFDAHSRALLRRFISDWLWPRRNDILYSMLVTTVLAATTGAYPLVIKQSFDTLLKGDTTWLPWVLGAIVGVTAVRSMFLYLQTTTTQRIVLRLTTDIQRTVFRHLLQADYARLSRDTPGRLMSKLTNDVSFIQQAVQATINTVVRDLLSVIALVGAMFYLDPVIALVVLGGYPFAAPFIIQLTRRIRRFATQTQAELGSMTSLLTEKLSATRLIKTFRLEDYASGKVNQSFEDIFTLRMKAVSSKSRLEALLEALAGVAVAGVIYVAYWRIASGHSTVGDFMGLTSALLLAAQPIKAIGSLTARVQEGLAAVESLYSLLDEKPVVVDQPGAKPLVVTSGAIEFNKVSFVYEGDKNLPAVRNFTLSVAAGKTVALVGRSGAGKSTLINLVPRLFDVTSGVISIDGQNLKTVTLDSLRDTISIVSQDVTLFDDTIRANIRLGRLNATDAEIIAAAKTAAADEFILAQPEGYETKIGDRGMRLSGGQRQRITLARAILKAAPILLLDEATGSLDTESERLVQDALAKFSKNRTTLVIAHRLSTVQNADLICVMEQGEIAELGTHSELSAKGGIYAMLARSQLLSDPAVALPKSA